MKIGVLSDIHGNHFALEEVLKIAKVEKVEKLLLLGDLVGYYYHPDKVLQLLKGWDYVSIKGNHENILAQLLLKEKQLDDIRLKYGSGHRFALEKLSEDQIQTLITAPSQLQVEIDTVNIMMCHGSPWDPDQYLYPDSKKEMLDRCDDVDVDFILIGHSHYPFVVRNRFSTLINAGSVGQSRTVGGVASWVVINTSNKVFELKATPYATEELEKEIDIFDPEIHYLKEVLKRNRT
jgi:putative phosphoesterase